MPTNVIFNKTLRLTDDQYYKEETQKNKEILKRIYRDYDPKYHDAFVLRYNKELEKKALAEYEKNRKIVPYEKKQSI